MPIKAFAKQIILWSHADQITKRKKSQAVAAVLHPCVLLNRGVVCTFGLGLSAFFRLLPLALPAVLIHSLPANIIFRHP